MIIELGFCPDQSRQINHLPARMEFWRRTGRASGHAGRPKPPHVLPTLIRLSCCGTGPA